MQLLLDENDSYTNLNYNMWPCLIIIMRAYTAIVRRIGNNELYICVFNQFFTPHIMPYAVTEALQQPIT